MTTELTAWLDKTPVVPLVQADDAETAIAMTRALANGGLRVAEVVLRTDAALACLGAISREVTEVIAGAGTVLTASQAEESIEAGAQFIVSPGLDVNIVRVCQQRDVPVFPGTATPSEVMAALNLGLDTVKFFPASLAGGIPMLKALGSVFRSMRFMPTGGISIANLGDFLQLSNVLACGGSWLTPMDAVKAGDFGTLTRLAAEAVAEARKVRS